MSVSSGINKAKGKINQNLRQEIAQKARALETTDEGRQRAQAARNLDSSGRRFVNEWNSYVQEARARRESERGDGYTSYLRDSYLKRSEPSLLAAATQRGRSSYLRKALNEGSYQAGMEAYVRAEAAKTERRTSYMEAQQAYEQAQDEQRRASFTAGPVTPDYWERVNSAKSAVEEAKQRLDEARAAYEADTESKMRGSFIREQIISETLHVVMFFFVLAAMDTLRRSS
jgi:hypothetical protein